MIERKIQQTEAEKSLNKVAQFKDERSFKDRYCANCFNGHVVEKTFDYEKAIEIMTQADALTPPPGVPMTAHLMSAEFYARELGQSCWKETFYECPYINKCSNVKIPNV